jgi:hypothetical protein
VPASAQPQIISGVEQCYVDQSRATDANQTPDSCKQLQQSGGSNEQLSNDIKDAVRQANAANFENAFRWSITFAIALLVLTFGFSFLLPKQFKAAAYSEM